MYEQQALLERELLDSLRAVRLARGGGGPDDGVVRRARAYDHRAAERPAHEDHPLAAPLAEGFDTSEKVVNALVELVRRAVSEAEALRASDLQTGSQLVIDARRGGDVAARAPTINTASRAPSTGYRTPRNVPRGVEISAVCLKPPVSAGSEVVVTPLLLSSSPPHPATLEKTTPANPSPPSTRNVRRLVALPTNISVPPLFFEGGLISDSAARERLGPATRRPAGREKHALEEPVSADVNQGTPQKLWRSQTSNT